MEFIAEIGLNHNGDLDLALRMVEKAAESGATTAKFQTYFPSERVEVGHPLFTLFEECMLSQNDFERIAGECESQGITFLTTAFGLDSLAVVQDLGLSRLKIASFSIGNRALLGQAISLGFELIVSTGASSESEILECNRMLGTSTKHHMFLHCISEYPVSDPSHLNLVNIAEISRLTGREVGFSDHTVGSEAFFAASLAGCRVFEKHFTTNKELKGPDQEMSASPAEFKSAVEEAMRGQSLLGEARKGPYSFEAGILPFRIVN